MKHAPATPAAHPPGQTRIEALSPEFLDAAAALAAELGLPRDGDADFALQLGPAGLQLQELGPGAAGPVRVDFVEGALAHRE